MNWNYVEHNLNFPVMLSSHYIIQITITELMIVIEILYADVSHEFQGNSILIHVQCNGVSSGQSIQIQHHWINDSLLEYCEYNKELYEEAASWSGIPTVYQEINNVWGYYKILLSSPRLVVPKLCLTPKPFSDKDYFWIYLMSSASQFYPTLRLCNFIILWRT